MVEIHLPQSRFLSEHLPAIGHVLRHHAPRADHAVRAQLNAGKDYASRPDAREILHHGWFGEIVGVIYSWLPVIGKTGSWPNKDILTNDRVWRQKDSRANARVVADLRTAPDLRPGTYRDVLSNYTVGEHNRIMPDRRSCADLRGFVYEVESAITELIHTLLSLPEPFQYQKELDLADATLSHP